MGELIGYARCSTVLQDLTAQRQALAALGVPDDRIYLDKGLTGTSRARPGLDQALAAVRSGDTLVVPKLDRLARSVPDARHIGDSLVARGIKLSLGGTIYDPADPLGKMFFNILATFAEFEVDLLRLRTREGMAVARAKGKLKGKQPKLTGSRPSSPACTPPATTPSPTSWKSSPSAAPPCTAPSSAPLQYANGRLSPWVKTVPSTTSGRLTLSHSIMSRA
jgi:DNA invertase Pin-like site-specific DNA recombinase